MQSLLSRARTLATAATVALVSGAVVLGSAAPGGASSPSDSRANFVAGNAVTCAQVGFEGAKIAFADGNASINQDGIVGSVQAHAGGGEEANISATGGNTILAVVIKGGPAYNVYTANSGSPSGNHVPPTEVNPQHYIAPLNGGGNVPQISHWFVCYEGEGPPPSPPAPGSLLVSKVVSNVNPGVTPAANYTVAINCDDGTTATRTLPGAGGPAIEGAVTNITAGSFCTVEETSLLPSGVAVTYSPAGANGPDGVEVESGTQVTVTVTNDYSLVAAEVVAQPRFTG